MAAPSPAILHFLGAWWRFERRCCCRSGTPLDPACDAENATLGGDAQAYLIVDTDVVLQQTDFLEHESVQDVIILSTVFHEVHKKNTSVFLRLKQMLRAGSKRFFYFSNEHCQVRSRVCGFLSKQVLLLIAIYCAVWTRTSTPAFMLYTISATGFFIGVQFEHHRRSWCRNAA